MNSPDLVRERKQAVFSVVLTAIWIPLLIVTYFNGAHWVILISAVGFMAGYIVERLRLLRTITALQQRAEAAARPAPGGA